MTSMEEFGPVSVDYFNGRKVESVSGEEDEAAWSIYFEGGGVVHNFDSTIPAPKAIVGAALTMVVMGIHKSERDRTPLTELRFGLEAVQLNPLEYAISDPAYTHGEIVFAQRSNANMPPELPPHPDERIAEGPTNLEDDNGEEG